MFVFDSYPTVDAYVTDWQQAALKPLHFDELSIQSFQNH
jgi:hypothetical protein